VHGSGVDVRVVLTEQGREYLRKLAYALEKKQLRRKQRRKVLKEYPLKFKKAYGKSESECFVSFSVKHYELCVNVFFDTGRAHFWLCSGRDWDPLPASFRRLCAQKALQALTPMVELELVLKMGEEQHRQLKQILENEGKR